jgi:hypothetical protein
VPQDPTGILASRWPQRGSVAVVLEGCRGCQTLRTIAATTALVKAVVLTGLVANTADIRSDFVDVLVLRKLPSGTLLYYGDGAQFAYEPGARR